MSTRDAITHARDKGAYLEALDKAVKANAKGAGWTVQVIAGLNPFMGQWLKGLAKRGTARAMALQK